MGIKFHHQLRSYWHSTAARRGRQFFLMTWPLVGQPYSRACSTLNSSWATQTGQEKEKENSKLGCVGRRGRLLDGRGKYEYDPNTLQEMLNELIKTVFKKVVQKNIICVSNVRVMTGKCNHRPFCISAFLGQDYFSTWKWTAWPQVASHLVSSTHQLHVSSMYGTIGHGHT